MVALNSSRRTPSRLPLATGQPLDALAAPYPGSTLRDSVEAGASRRSRQGAVVVRDAAGQITHIRIGRWRVLAAGPQRRLTEVRELPGQRIAVRLERYADTGHRANSQIWQLYDPEGRLEAALQISPDGRFGLLSDYRTRQACRLVRNENDELQRVEIWSI